VAAGGKLLLKPASLALSVETRAWVAICSQTTRPGTFLGSGAMHRCRQELLENHAIANTGSAIFPVTPKRC